MGPGVGPLGDHGDPLRRAVGGQGVQRGQPHPSAPLAFLPQGIQEGHDAHGGRNQDRHAAAEDRHSLAEETASVRAVLG